METSASFEARSAPSSYPTVMQSPSLRIFRSSHQISTRSRRVVLGVCPSNPFLSVRATRCHATSEHNWLWHRPKARILRYSDRLLLQSNRVSYFRACPCKISEKTGVVQKDIVDHCAGNAT